MARRKERGAVIRVRPAPEPPTFDADVRKPGEMAISEMIGQAPNPPRAGGKPFKQRYRKVLQPDGSEITVPIVRAGNLPSSEFPTYWQSALPHMMKAYHEICAYSCFRIHKITGAASVDHMVPKSRDWRQIYEWANYRLCSSRMNARKGDLSSILDPFDIDEDGRPWFELEWVSRQVRPNPSLPKDVRDQIQQTIDHLNLNDAAFLQKREEDVKSYEDGDISFPVLVRESPFIARELKRQGRLRP